MSRVKRFFGGDFEQVGFIRRNIIQALEVLNYFDAEVEKHLLAAMEDPLFRGARSGLPYSRSFWPDSGGKRSWLNRVLDCSKTNASK